MQDAETVLVIILSVTLTVFLIIGIILLTFLVKLAKTLNEIASKAQDVVGNVESASEILKNAAGPIAMGKLLVGVADIFKTRKGK